MADGYRAKGRIHDMRPTDARTKVKQKDPFGGIGGPSTRNKAQDRQLAKSMGESKAGYKKAARRQKMGKLGKGLNSMAEDNDKLAAQSQADMQDFRNRAAGMSAERQRMQQSTSGKAQAIIKNRRI
jgi:hypothetical protein